MNESIRLIKGSEDDFPEVYAIMEKAFPESERRDIDGQRKLLGNPYYHYYILRTDGKISAFLAIWEFPEINFIEHFAVAESLRGKGVGKKFLSAYLSSADKPVFLEVEPPENDIAVRRIGFYKRLGFHLNSFPYFQPALQEGQKPIPLKIMTYPEPISEENFLRYKKTAFKHAYQKKEG